MDIYMIRHGMTKGNQEHRYVGSTEEELLPEAKRQLRKKKLPPVERVYASPRKRCLESAALLYPEQEPIVVEALAECDFGEFEYCNYEELNGNPDYQRFIDSEGRSGFPGGEDREQFQSRCLCGFQEILQKEAAHRAEDGAGIALVVHGGTIMAILDALANPHREYYSWQVKNGQGYAASLVWEADGSSCSLERVWLIE